MGVKFLWDIIDITKTKETLDCLKGKIVSVDLSIWIMEAIKTLEFKGNILKPYLRIIFFRILALRRLGVKILFVTEGDPPELKHDTIRKRIMTQRGGVKTDLKKKVGRSRFDRLVKECTNLFDILGIPHIRAEGEAEAMCAYLNVQGFTDGCLTNDGDVFLYGGQVVYRDFGIDPKDPHIFIYSMSEIKSRLRLNRNDLVGLALIAGCDYCKGIDKIGRITVRKFLEERKFQEDILSRMAKWITNKDLGEISKSEATIMKKALNMNNFFNRQVIDEFLINRNNSANLKKTLKFGYPDIKLVEDFLLQKLEWPEEYTLPKLLQLASSTYLEKLSDGTFFPVPVEPIDVVKTRCRQGAPLVELKWTKCDDGISTYSKKWQNCPHEFITLENQQVVMKVLPGLVENFLKLKEEKKCKKTTKKKTGLPKKSSEVPTKCGATKKMKDSQGYVDDYTKIESKEIAGDFQDDLSDSFQYLYSEESIHQNHQEKKDSQTNDDRGFLPLSQRLALRTETINNNENCQEESRKSFPSSSIFTDSSDTDNCNYLSKDTEKNIDNRFKSDLEKVLKLLHSDDEPMNEDFSSRNNINVVSTPILKDKSLHSKLNTRQMDITNFSSLGDSILCDSFESMNITQSPCVVRIDSNKENRDPTQKTSKISMRDLDDQKLNDKSPLSLADRLKRRNIFV